MIERVPKDYENLLADETKAYAYLATTMSDGTPQVTPVWFNTANGHILINTAEGRTKYRNMCARPRVAVCIADPSDPYRYLQIRGEVAGYSTEGADAHIDALSFKYTARTTYQWRKQSEQRVIFRIHPLHIDAH